MHVHPQETVWKFFKNNYAAAEAEFTDMQIFNTVYTRYAKLGDFNEVYSFGKVH